MHVRLFGESFQRRLALLFWWGDSSRQCVRDSEVLLIVFDRGLGREQGADDALNSAKNDSDVTNL